MNQQSPFPPIVVMGVSGCGKSSLGRILAERFGIPFIEGDELHSAASLAKMASGIALYDEDRWPWLDCIGGALQGAENGAVVSCSALKAAYRERLRSASEKPILFVFIDGDRSLIEDRLKRRPDHFMPTSLLGSQFDALEPPGQDEWSIGLSASDDLSTSASRVEQFLLGAH